MTAVQSVVEPELGSSCTIPAIPHILIASKFSAGRTHVIHVIVTR